MKSILKKSKKGKSIKCERRKNYLGSTLYPFGEMFHSFWLGNRMKSYFMILLPIFYPSSPSSYCYAALSILFFKWNIDEEEHCGEHLKNE